MPEEKEAQAEVQQQAPAGGRRRAGPALIAAVVVVIAAVVGAMFLLKGGQKPPEELAGKAHKTHSSPELLDIPTLEVADIMIAVPVDSAGVQRRGLSIGVTVFFAPPEGEHAEIAAIKADVTAKSPSMSAIFRYIMIRELNTKEYGKLVKSDIQEGLLGTFKDAFNSELTKYGLDKTMRVDRVVWSDFSWN